MKVGLTVSVAGVMVVMVAFVINENYSPDGMPAVPPGSSPLSMAPAPGAATAEGSVREEMQADDGPSFDLVRVARDGHTVIAGQAKPGSRVVVLDGDSPLGDVIADARGEWVFLPSAPLQPGEHWLGLVVQAPEGEPVFSADIMIVIVPEPGQDIAGRTAGGQDGPLAMRVARSGVGPAMVMQKPNQPVVAQGLSIDAIDNDAVGRVTFSGKATAHTIVHVYVGDEPAGQAVADAGGRWLLRLETTPFDDQPSSDVTVRADQLDAEGTVLARVAVPLQDAHGVTRATRDRGRAGRDEAAAFVEVKAGHNLWRIARNVYGSGQAYTMIYEANRNEIETPDLIFPGQVFALPEL